jgi:murein DD-endopeptidase MepM/ murein hydrolase activator NlpD
MKRSQIVAFGSAALLMLTAQVHAAPQGSDVPDRGITNAAGLGVDPSADAPWPPAFGWPASAWLADSVRHPVRLWSEWTAYEARIQPGSLFAYWVSDRVNRVLGLFSAEGRGPMPGIADFGVLAVLPVAGVESSGYGYRRHPITGRRTFHKGVDFRAPRGTPVYAAGPGVVSHARRKSNYGKLIIISHGLGLETRYAHLSRIKIQEGEFVPAGTFIGTVGSTGRTTGPHLHFEVRQFDEPVDPLWALGETRSTFAEGIAAVFRWLKAQ